MDISYLLEEEESGSRYPLQTRILTIGSDPDCTIRLKPPCPQYAGHCLFIKGFYYFQPLTYNIPVTVNGKKIVGKYKLCPEDIITIGATKIRFIDTTKVSDNIQEQKDTVGELIEMVILLLRKRDHDITTNLMTIISRILQCDAARIVNDDPQSGKRFTLVRYPIQAGLDRFSNRAIDWAKEASRTILVTEPEWTSGSENYESLELNAVTSILCAPLQCGDRLTGYLYLDRLRNRENFTEQERAFCDRLLPLFSEILAISEEHHRQSEMIKVLQQAQENTADGIIYRSDKMKSLISLVDRIATTDSPVLIEGETGTGKELLARRIHQKSLRNNKPFKAINCGAIPENLIESELFGHEKGAFTGAHTQKTGLFEAAHEGTVFLDEIGEMPIHLQVKLLRVLQESEVVLVGGTRTVKVNVRIIAATNKHLKTEVANKTFRSDLFFRLNVLSLTLPPLRERSEDILLLANYFLNKYCSRLGQAKKTLLSDAEQWLVSYLWPGNVRELENVIQRAVVMSASDRIGKFDFEYTTDEELIHPDSELISTMHAAREMAEKDVINRALQASMGNISQTSRILDVDRKWLFTKMNKFGIKADKYRMG